MNALMMALAIWVAGVTGYPVPAPGQLPDVVLMAPAELKARVLGKSAAKSTYEVVGGYDDEKNEILLGNDFVPGRIKDQANLVHELIHFFQAKNRIRPPLCENSDEAEAYGVENRWMAEHGLPPSVSEFHIQMMSLCNGESIDDAIDALKAEARNRNNK